MSTTYTGVISLLQNEKRVVFPITSADGVLLEPTDTTTKLSEKLVEIDKDIEQITKVTNTIQKDGDGSIEYTEAGLAHTNTTTIQQGLNPIANEAIYKFKIDKNGHITDIKEASLEDFGVGMPIKYCGEYNSSFTLSVGGMYLVNAEFIKKYNKGDVNDFAIYNGIDFNIIQSDINPNIQLNNSKNRIYGTGNITNIYAPTTLGTSGQVLTTTTNAKNELELKWDNIPTTNVEFNSDGNKLTIGDKTISFTGGTGISVNSNSTNTIKVSSLYSYDERDFITDNNTISLKNPQEQVKLSAGDGITINKSEISVKLDPSSESQYLTVGEGGLKLNGIESAVSKQISESINKLSGSTKGASEHVKVTVTQTDGNITGVTVAENNIASITDLANEITARKAVDGQSGQAYAKNTKATHIKNATSLNNADVLLSNALDTEIAHRTSADTNLSNQIASLQGSVESMYASYPYITEEIWGKNHNWDWAQASRIDKLGNAFNWGLRFSDGIILAPHNNGIIIPQNSLEKIYLPRCGKCEIGYTVTSDSNITVTFGNVSVECNKNQVRRTSSIKLFLSEPYLTIKSSGGKAYLTDIVIYFEDGPINICSTLQTSLINNNSISKTIKVFEYDNKTNSDICKFELNNVAPGFYQFTYSIKGTKITYKTENGTPVTYYTIASLLYNIETMPDKSFTVRNTNHYHTNIDFYTKDCKLCNDIDKAVTDYTTFQAIYYIPKKQNVTLYLRTFNLGTFYVKDISFKPISWSSKVDSADVAGEANNLVSIGSNITTTVIGGSTQIKSDSSYFNFTTDSQGDVILQYIKNNEILWTLGKNFSNTKQESIKYTSELGWFKLDGDTMPDGVFTSADSGPARNILLGYLNTTQINTLYKGTDNRYYENNTGTLIQNSYAKQITKQTNPIGEEYYMKITPMVNGMQMITTGYYIKNSTGVYTWVDEPLIQG